MNLSTGDIRIMYRQAQRQNLRERNRRRSTVVVVVGLVIAGLLVFYKGILPW